MTEYFADLQEALLWVYTYLLVILAALAAIGTALATVITFALQLAFKSRAKLS